MPQNSNNNTKPKSNSINSPKSKSNNTNNSKSINAKKSQSQQARPNTTEQDGGLKFFDKMKNKYTDWKTRRAIITEAQAKAEKAVALNKFNRLKSQYGFKGGDKK